MPATLKSKVPRNNSNAFMSKELKKEMIARFKFTSMVNRSGNYQICCNYKS